MKKLIILSFLLLSIGVMAAPYGYKSVNVSGHWRNTSSGPTYVEPYSRSLPNSLPYAGF